MDTIFLHQLAIDTVIGIYDWEQDIRQPLIIDVDMYCPTGDAARAGDLARTADYHAVANRIKALLADRRYPLLESVAEAIADTILGEFAIQRIRIRVTKPTALPGQTRAGVVIERPALPQRTDRPPSTATT